MQQASYRRLRRPCGAGTSKAAWALALRGGEADRQLSAWSLEIRLFLQKTFSKVAKEGNVLNLIKGICVNLQAPPPFTVGGLVPHGQEQGQNVLSHWSCSRRPVLTGAPRQETEQAPGSGREGGGGRLCAHRTFCAGRAVGSSQKPPELKSEFREAAGATPPSPHGLPHPLARAWSHSFSHVASLLQGSLLWHARLVTNHAALLSFILTSSGF